MPSDSEQPNTEQSKGHLAAPLAGAACGDEAVEPRLTQQDVASVAKLLERLRTGEMNLIPSLVPGTESRDPNGKSEATLLRVEQLLNEWLRRQDQPLGDGGPAFPRDHAHDGHNGMTLRDYFAAKAMAVIVANPIFFERYGFSEAKTEEANFAYEMADAMLKARQA